MKTCNLCGASDFYKSGQCKPCARLRSAAWAKENREKIAIWRAANKDHLKAYNAAWRDANRAYVNALNAAWCAANPDKKKASDANWRKSNPERARLNRAEYHIKNRDVSLAKNAAWKAENPEKVRIYNRNRRAKKRMADGSLSPGLPGKLYKLQRGKCACGCKQPLGDDYHMDHRMPLALGGSNTDDNMQLLRAKCNMQKNAKHPVDFMRQRGFLI